MANILELRIHPAIGVMRVGNSPGYFVGPELPWDRDRTVFKDSQNRILRQAARFRVWAYWDNGKQSLISAAPLGPAPAVQDPDGPDVISGASIEWRVSLGNKKAAWASRNHGVKKDLLWIRPGNGTLDTAQGLDATHVFDDGKISFDGQNFVAVPLGEMRTDAEGNLLMLGGFGKSESPTNAPLLDSNDNAGWYDDTSDGPINATVVIDGKPYPVLPAWVICAPPKFAPQIDAPTTLYDQLLQTSLVNVHRSSPQIQEFLDSYVPSFRQDIAPILQRAIDMFWVAGAAQCLPNSNDYRNFHSDQLAGFLEVPDPEPGDPNTIDRYNDVFGWLEPPPGAPTLNPAPKYPVMMMGDMEPSYLGWYGTMPLLDGKPDSRLTLFQYTMMLKWASSRSVGMHPVWLNDEPPAQRMTPEALDQAPLETCIGASLAPGIEAGTFLTGPNMQWTEAFRIDPSTGSPLVLDPNNMIAGGLEPGDITAQMSEPWQTDFNRCGLSWWPSARPVSVFRLGDSYGINNLPVPWLPWGEGVRGGGQEMVDNWHRLGFVVKDANSGAHVLTDAALGENKHNAWETNLEGEYQGKPVHRWVPQPRPRSPSPQNSNGSETGVSEPVQRSAPGTVREAVTPGAAHPPPVARETRRLGPDGGGCPWARPSEASSTRGDPGGRRSAEITDPMPFRGSGGVPPRGASPYPAGAKPNTPQRGRRPLTRSPVPARFLRPRAGATDSPRAGSGAQPTAEGAKAIRDPAPSVETGDKNLSDLLPHRGSGTGEGGAR